MERVNKAAYEQLPSRQLGAEKLVMAACRKCNLANRETVQDLMLSIVCGVHGVLGVGAASARARKTDTAP